MPLEVYKLTVQMGFRRNSGPGQTTNVFYFGVDNQADLNSYDCAADLSASFAQTLGWLHRWQWLYVFANRVRKWTIVRVAPQPGALFDDSREMYSVTGLRFVVLGVHFLTTRVVWFLDDGHARLPYNQIGFSSKIDWDDDEIWTPYAIEVHNWAQVHRTPAVTPQGNPYNAVCRRSSDVFSAVVGHRVDSQPGRRITRREPR